MKTSALSSIALAYVCLGWLTSCGWPVGGGCSERKSDGTVTACTQEVANTPANCAGGTSNARYEWGPCPTSSRVGRCTVYVPASGISAARTYVRAYYSPQYADGDARDDCASLRDFHGPGTAVRYAAN